MAFPKLLILSFVLHLLLVLEFCDSKCPKSFTCQNLGSLEYPLTDVDHPDCGLIKMNCSSPPELQFVGDATVYEVAKQISKDKFTVRDTMLQFHLKNNNCFSFRSPFVSVSPFISFVISPNLTLNLCDRPFADSPSVKEHFKDYKNYSKCDAFDLYYRDPDADVNLANDTPANIPSGCRLIQLPMNASENSSDDLFKLLTYEYTIEWHVSIDKQENSKKMIMIRAGPAGWIMIPLVVLVSSILIFYRKKLLRSLGLQKASHKYQLDIELFLKNHGNLAPKRYKYSHLKKISNSFSESLGKGGYGSVYKGQLQDGRVVAIKILNEAKGNGEEFINEVSSISRTSHVNVVALLGFCFEGSKRALIYEYMPNGSLDKFIPNASSPPKTESLGLEKLFEIAVGIAKGLEYLHQGCNMRILHFDIKPHNILLDKDMKPKISDFGLSKLCPNRSSIVSMLGARGTAGYIAPEVFSRSFGDVSHKSDVYSYGMMVLEMVVGRHNNVDLRGERSSEMYFSDWIYMNLEQSTSEKCVINSNILPEDKQNVIRRKLIIIGLWCIQSDPRNRPSISRVIELLEAKLESLQLPPRQDLSSPPIQPQILSV